jgi:C1A family cysteine protease
MGWIPDLPDGRDYTFRNKEIVSLLRKYRRARTSRLPDSVDLSADDEGEYFSPPDDQGRLNSSTACSVIALVEYFERRLRGRTFDGSRLFLYKVTRNYRQKSLQLVGDTGADLRTTLKVLVQIGVPAEELWPYDVSRLDEDPSQYSCHVAKAFSHLRYFRLDEPNCNGVSTWETLRSFLAAGFPVAFGFSVPTSITDHADVPYRPGLDGIRGGQAVVAIGYRIDYFGRGQHALLIRSSWGSQWGENGKGWLPISYVRAQLARDFWTVVSDDWDDFVELTRPTVIDSLGKRTPS